MAVNDVVHIGRRARGEIVVQRVEWYGVQVERLADGDELVAV